MDDDKIKLGVLWKNISRKGNKPYLAGRVHRDTLDAAVQLMRTGGRFLILSNTKRPDKQDPDCVLFVVPEREPPDAQRERESARQGRDASDASRRMARATPGAPGRR